MPQRIHYKGPIGASRKPVSHLLGDLFQSLALNTISIFMIPKCLSPALNFRHIFICLLNI